MHVSVRVHAVEVGGGEHVFKYVYHYFFAISLAVFVPYNTGLLLLIIIIIILISVFLLIIILILFCSNLLSLPSTREELRAVISF